MIRHYLRMFDWRFVYKSSINGRFVTRAYAALHPATTYRERVPVCERVK